MLFNTYIIKIERLKNQIDILGLLVSIQLELNNDNVNLKKN